MDKIKKFFLYLFTGIGLVLVLIGSVSLIDIGLKTYVFKNADYYYCPSMPEPVTSRDKIEKTKIDNNCEIQRTSQRQREAANGIAMVVVGSPVLLFFYRKTLKI